MTPTVLCRVAARSRIWRCERRLGAGERLKDAAFGGFGLWRPVGRGRLAQPEGGLLSVFHELDLDVVETACGAMLDGHEGLPVPAAQVEVTVSPGVQLTAAPQGLSRRLCCKPDVGVSQIRTTTVLSSCFCVGQTVL